MINACKEDKYISTAMQKSLSLGFPTRSNTKQRAKPQKMARGLKFWILEVKGLYYLCSENKGAEPLRSYSLQMQKSGFLMMQLI